MTYNLRPRRASVVSGVAAVSEVCSSRRQSTHEKHTGTQGKQERRHCTGDCRARPPHVLLRGWEPPAASTSAGQVLPRRMSTGCFASDYGTPPPEPAAEKVGEQPSCGRHTRSNQSHQHDAAQHKIAMQTAHGTQDCAAEPPVKTRVDGLCAAEHLRVKWAPPHMRGRDDVSLRSPQQEPPPPAGMPFAADNLPTTSTCHTLLPPPAVGSRLTGASPCKVALACRSELVQTSYSPRVSTRHADTGVPPSQLRVADTAPQTPACSKGSIEACEKNVTQEGYPSGDPKYSATTSQRHGSNKTSQVLMLLSPSTVTTPSASRGRKRKRGHSRVGGVSFKNRGLSPQSLSHRTRTTASTIPSPSDLASPPATLPLTSAITPARLQDGAALSPNATGDTLSTLQCGGKLSTTAPPVSGEEGPTLPLSVAQRETLLRNGCSQNFPSAGRNQPQDQALALKRIYSQTVASRGHGASHANVDLPWSNVQIPDSASSVTPGTSSVSAQGAPASRQNDMVHTKASGSPLRSAADKEEAKGRPSRVRWLARHTSSQPQARSQQGEDTQPERKFSTSLQEQSAESQTKTPTVLQLSNRISYSTPGAVCEGLTKATSRGPNGTPEGRGEVWLKRGAQCQQDGDVGEELTATNLAAPHCYTAVHSSADLQARGVGHYRFSGEENLSHAISPSSYRLRPSRKLGSTRSGPAAVADGCNSPAEDGMTWGAAHLTAVPCLPVSARQCSVLTKVLSRTSACQFRRVDRLSSSSTNLPGPSVTSLLLRSLPPLILCRILRLLPPSSLAAFGATCTYARELLRLPSTWRHLDERCTGRWMRYFEKLAKQSSTSDRRETDASPSEPTALQNICGQNTWDPAVAAAPFACVSRISVDLTCVRGLNQTRSVTHAFFDLPAVALLRFAPSQIGRSGIARVAAASEGGGLRRIAGEPTTAATAAGTFLQPSGRRPAAPSSRSSTALQYPPLPLCGATSAAGTAYRSAGAALIPQIQSVSEQRPTSQQGQTRARDSFAHGDGTVRRQRHRITSLQGVADRPSETQAGAQLQQQTTDEDLGRSRGGGANDMSVLQQRSRLRRTLTVVLSNQISESHPSGGLAVEPRGPYPPTLRTSREPIESASPCGVERGVGHGHTPRPDQEESSGGVQAQSAPPSQQIANALDSRRRMTGSHASVEEETLSLRGIRRRRIAASPTESRLSMLLRNLYAQTGTSDNFCWSWGSQHHHFVREEENHRAAAVPSTQQWAPRHHTTLHSECAFRAGQSRGTGENLEPQNRPVAEEQSIASRCRGACQTTVSNEESSPPQFAEEGNEILQLLQSTPQPNLRRDRYQLVFLHQLLMRLQQTHHLTEGHQLLGTAFLIPRALSRQPSLSSTRSATEMQTTPDFEECNQQRQRSRLTGSRSLSVTPQNRIYLEEREARLGQPPLQVTEEIGVRENISQGRPCNSEPRGQNTHRTHVSSVCPVDPVPEDHTMNISRGRNPLQLVDSRTIVSTRTDHQYTAARGELHFVRSQAGVGGSTRDSLRDPSATAQCGRSMQEGVRFSGQVAADAFRPSRRTNEGLAAERPVLHAVEATGIASSSSSSTAVVDDGRDVQRLRILRGLLVHMHQLVQINFKLQARELSRLPHLREEVLIITNLLRHNAATLRLIKFSVDMTAVEGSAEGLAGRNSGTRNAAETSVRLPFLELPRHLPALQVFHTDYPFQVPSGFSASTSFTQLCVRSLHRFFSPLFKTDSEQTQPANGSSDLRTTNDPSSNELREFGGPVFSPTRPTNVSSTESKARPELHSARHGQNSVRRSKRHRETDKWDDFTSEQNDGGTGYGAEQCAPHALMRQYAATDVTGTALLSCTSSFKRARNEHPPQGECFSRSGKPSELQLGPGRPPRCRRISLPESIKPNLQHELPEYEQRDLHGSVNVRTEETSDIEDSLEAKAGFRRRQLLRLPDLGLSPCHTLTPQSDIALSLQSSPASGTREELLGQLRDAFTPRLANDVRENDAQTKCDGEVELGPRTDGSVATSKPSNEHMTAACNTSILPSPPSITSRERLDDTYCSRKAPVVSGYATTGENSMGDLEKSRREALRRSPVAHLQRLLHIGRETLQQVDLQGDPPRTFCCLHSRLKFSKLRRLSLGWTCTAELVLLHSMLLKGHLPQLRKLQFSGPSGGSGLSMMHLQLYALLNTPPSTCPHHPPIPLPATVLLPPSNTGDLITSPPLPPSSETTPSCAYSKSRERSCKEYYQTAAQSGSRSKRQGTHHTFTHIEEEAEVKTSPRRSALVLQGERCASNGGDSWYRQQRNAGPSLSVTELFAEQAAPFDEEPVAPVLLEDSRGGRKASPNEDSSLYGGVKQAPVRCEKYGRTDLCQQRCSGVRSTAGAATASQVPRSIERGPTATERIPQDLTSLRVLAKGRSTLGCERCAAMRGGTAHGVYFKYAALDIDFAALIEFRLALQRHGLFAFYKDERNKLNLLHVEGLTDVTGRDALDEEKSLESRLERKNEWKRRFAYNHIQSPPFSFSSSTHSDSREGDPHSRSGAFSEDLVNAALWSVAPLPPNRAPFSRNSSIVSSDLLPPQVSSASTTPASLNHGVASETNTHNRGITTSHTRSPCERSGTEVQPPSGLARSRGSISGAGAVGVSPASLSRERGRVGAFGPAAAEGVRGMTASSHDTPATSSPSLRLFRPTPESGAHRVQDRRQINGDHQTSQVTPVKTGAGVRAETPFQPSQLQFSPRDRRPQRREPPDSEVEKGLNPPVSGPSEVRPSPVFHDQGYLFFSGCMGTHDVASCTQLHQKAAEKENASQGRPWQETKHHSRRGNPTFPSSAETIHLSGEAACCERNIDRICRVRRDRVVANVEAEDENHCSLNCTQESAVLPAAELIQGSLNSRAENGTCRTTLTTQEGGEQGHPEEAVIRSSSRAAGSSASPLPGDLIREDATGGTVIIHAAGTEPRHRQPGYTTQSHSQPSSQQQYQRQMFGAVPNDEPLLHRSDENACQQATAGKEADGVPRQDRIRTSYFPNVCPTMSGRDLFFLEMWLAPELCRDLQSAPTLFQLSKQLRYLWEHKLTAEQRGVYNNVIVKRYVQEREAVQEWNFSTAKAWWMGS